MLFAHRAAKAPNCGKVSIIIYLKNNTLPKYKGIPYGNNISYLIDGKSAVKVQVKVGNNDTQLVLLFSYSLILLLVNEYSRAK